MKPAPFHGLLVVDKPGGLTSRDVVNRAQRWFPRGTRLGHTGTLDPLATGVLVLCVGNATRLAEYVQDMGKTYRAGLILGARSSTDDADGNVTPVEDARPPEVADVARVVHALIGEIEQVPPAFSAAKVTGQRAYDRARRGEEVSLRPRRVRVYGIDVLRYEYPSLELEVYCGKGTYIRSLARDLGERLGCGAYVERLRRTRVGPFSADGALAADATTEEARSRLLPVAAAVAEMPHVTLSGEEAARLRQGQRVRCGGLPRDLASGEATVAVFDGDGVLVGVATLVQPGPMLKPAKVLAP